MNPESFRNALILTGPTGSGKSNLGVELAERLGAEIISMDSMALYRGMDIGTAKPGPDERRRVPHHLIDVLDPWESSSVAWWLERAADRGRRIEERGRRVLFVGGTPLYLKALLFGLFEGPPAEPALRQQLVDEAAQAGLPSLHARLAQVDPPAAQRIHPHDLRRIIRALEVWELTGKPISCWQTQWAVSSGQWAVGSGQWAVGSGQWAVGSGQWAEQHHHAPSTEAISSTPTTGPSSLPTAHCPLPTVLWLDLPRAELYARIDQRVHDMIASGLVEEVQGLRELPRSLSREASQALGYREMFDHLDGRATLADTVTRIQTRSRHFAKRQLTWFRHVPGCRAVNRELTFRLWGLTME